MIHKKALISLIFLSAFIMSFAPVSADQALEDFLSDDVTQITITLTQTDSQVDFTFTPAGASFDSQSVDIPDNNIDSIEFKVSEVLSDINGEAEIQSDSDITQFNSLDVTDGNPIIRINDGSGSLFTTTKGFFDRVSDNYNLNIDVSDLSSVNSYLSAHPLPVVSDRHVVFTKSGSEYVLWNDVGFGTTPENWEDEIRQRIAEGVESVNLKDIFDQIAPFLSSNGLDLALFDGLDMDYTVGETDVSGIFLEDGIHIITVPVVKDGVTYEKNITLVLNGIEHQDNDVNVFNGTYTAPASQPGGGIGDFIGNITGLSASKITVIVFDQFPTKPSNTKALKFLEITVDVESSADINFKIKKTLSDNPEDVSLYRYNDTSGAWGKLPTVFTGESEDYYLFTAQTPGFSTFLIAEDLATSTSSSGANRDNYYRYDSASNSCFVVRETASEANRNGDFSTLVECEALIVSEAEQEGIGNPINLGEPESQDSGGIAGFFRALGAVVGAPTAAGGLVTLIVAILVVGAMFFGARGLLKRKDLNENGDEDGE